MSVLSKLFHRHNFRHLTSHKHYEELCCTKCGEHTTIPKAKAFMATPTTLSKKRIRE